jgi:hypothetical protein
MHNPFCSTNPARRMSGVLCQLALFAVACVVCAIVFAPVLPLNQVLQAPDGMPADARLGLMRRMAHLLGSNPTFPTFDDLLRAFPPLAHHELSFIVATALLAVAAAAYMRAAGISALASCAGGLALAFSGYNFTLFNAGHRGIFIAAPYAVFSFALVERALKKPRWSLFALLALCLVAAVTAQPDTTVLYFMALAAYGVCRFAAFARAEGFKRYLARVGRGLAFGLAIAFFVGLSAGFPVLKKTLTETLAGREAQIEQTLKASAAAPANVAATTAAMEDSTTTESAAKAAVAEKKARWIFATNWSLPPEDCLEFIAPVLRGLDTVGGAGAMRGRPVPYWGRLGRTDGWEETQFGFHNYRQHSTHLGAATCALAFFALVFALVSAFAARANRDADTAPATAPSPSAAPDATAPDNTARNGMDANARSIVFFWTAVFIISLLLAFGRHAPFYKAFYSLPLMDKIRAPVKFLHVAELALSILFASGVASLVQHCARRGRPFRLAATISIAATAALALGCLAAALAFSPESKAALWSSMGIPAGDIADTLAALYKNSLARAFWILALAAGTVAAAAFAPRRIALGAVALLAIAAVCDLAESASRFVTPIDYFGRTAPNPAAEALKKSGADLEGASYSYVRLTNQIIPPSAAPFLESLGNYGLHSADPVQGDTADSPRAIVWTAFGNDEFRRLEFLGAQMILTTPDIAREFVRAGKASLTSAFDIDQRGSFAQPRDMSRPSAAVLRPFATLPTATIFYSWRVASNETAAARAAAARDFDIANTVVLTGAEIPGNISDAKRAPAEWKKRPTATGGASAILSTESERDGLLAFSPGLLGSAALSAKVNGAPAPVYTANIFWRAVPVPAGKATIKICHAIKPLSAFYASASAAIFLALLALTAFRPD